MAGEAAGLAAARADGDCDVLFMRGSKAHEKGDKGVCPDLFG
jgi:hypothetical protein